LNYKYENGRRYHSYRDGNYGIENDEAEPPRLDMLHHIFQILTGGELWRAPIRGPNAALPKRVLDLGTGTGTWALEAAEELSGATVIGNDLTTTTCSSIPANCHFVVSDFEQPWNYPPKEKFDFIHGRALCGSVSDFPKLLRQIYDNLNPGGWVEFQDYIGRYSSDDDTLGLVPAMTEWRRQLSEASEKAGKPLNIADEFKRLFQEAGFVHVQEERYKVGLPVDISNINVSNLMQGPIGTWAKGKTNKELGRFLLAQNLDAIEPFTQALYTRALGYNLQQTQRITEVVRADFLNKGKRPFRLFGVQRLAEHG
jgi:SAM-dependent methyltransferase